ncbi:MAG TPA: hypothetical protein PLP05_05140 [Sedimentisphaerales bacterium]|nr:hypothetical protein [Sedimentisphaerales bacterium]
MDVVKGEEINDSTQHYEVLMQLGDCHATVGYYELARQYYNKAAAIGPDEAGPYVGLGVISLHENHLEDADIAFRVAYRLNNSCSKAFAGMAMVHQQRGDYRTAFDLYLKCMELDPNNLTALLGLFQSSCQMGTFAKVIHYLELYLGMHPADVSVMFSLSALYMKEGRLDDSKKLLLDVIALDSSNHDAVNLLEEIEHKIAHDMQVGVNV